MSYSNLYQNLLGKIVISKIKRKSNRYAGFLLSVKSKRSQIVDSDFDLPDDVTGMLAPRQVLLTCLRM